MSTVEKARILIGLVFGALLLFELRKKVEGRPRLAAAYATILTLTFSVELHRALANADTLVGPKVGQAWATMMQANR